MDGTRIYQLYSLESTIFNLESMGIGNFCYSYI